MFPVVTAEQMQAIDRHAIDDLGIPGITLMENAGVGIVRELQKRFSYLSQKKVFVFCGKGNNGGDVLSLPAICSTSDRRCESF